jgi:dihydrofolate reductase/thymidylate synthase
MIELIVAMDEKYGIGKNGTIPWKCSGDLQRFKQLTMNEFVVMGRKTCENLPLLKDRDIICISRGCPDTSGWKNDSCDVNNIVDFKRSCHPKVKYFIAGGAEIYESFIDDCDKIHLSIIDGIHKCDTHFDKSWLDKFVTIREEKCEGFKHLTMIRRENNSEIQYLNIANRLVDFGEKRIGRNGETRSLFTEHMTFDLRDGFPLLTTKKMFLRGIIEELLFFLRGDTDTTILSDKKVRIWEGNTSSEFIKSRGLPYAQGVMGPMYGYQWRNFNSPYKVDDDGKPKNDNLVGIDQLKDVVNLIRTDPTSRRILMTTYNPSQSTEGVLYPCHSIVSQFYVVGEYLDMFCYNRSQDFFLGTPYNIASSSLLLMIVAKLTNKTARHFNLTTGDTHVYESHIDAVTTQITHIPYKKPTVEITKVLNEISDIHELKATDFILTDYTCYGSIKVDMVV